MKHSDIKEVVGGWETLTSTVMELKELELSCVQNQITKTYKLIKSFCACEVVPKEVTRLFLSMDEFLYFSSIMEGKEVSMDFYAFQAISCIVHAMKNGFFDGRFEYKFSDEQANEMYTIDVEGNGLIDYLHIMRNETSKDYSGIKLL